MDSTRSSEEVETEDQQAGVIRAILRSGPQIKRVKKVLREVPAGGAAGRKGSELSLEARQVGRGQKL